MLTVWAGDLGVKEPVETVHQLGSELWAVDTDNEVVLGAVTQGVGGILRAAIEQVAHRAQTANISSSDVQTQTVNRNQEATTQ